MEYKLTEESTPSSGKSLMNSKIVSELANIETIKRETLHDMEHEVIVLFSPKKYVIVRKYAIILDLLDSSSMRFLPLSTSFSICTKFQS